jgi:hypothetical protein
MIEFEMPVSVGGNISSWESGLIVFAEFLVMGSEIRDYELNAVALDVISITGPETNEHFPSDSGLSIQTGNAWVTGTKFA